MKDSFIYMPTLRSRQQENIVLSSFDFGKRLYPLVEIIKEVDRKRPSDSQKEFKEIYSELIDSIRAEKVFIDLPLYLPQRASMKKETLAFSRKTISNYKSRTEALNSLEKKEKIIPVISSYLNRTGSESYFHEQIKLLDNDFKIKCIRSLFNHFSADYPEIKDILGPEDYHILDLDSIAPYPSPQLKEVLKQWKELPCTKIILGSSINTAVTNVGLKHDNIVYDVDNSLQETFKKFFDADSFGDYSGIKKDEITSGGSISPGFLFYDAVKNHFVGYKGAVKELGEFEDTIIPAILRSKAVENMKSGDINYLKDNPGWETIINISNGNESGKSQAKFKKIAIEHYLHCMKCKAEAELFDKI